MPTAEPGKTTSEWQATIAAAVVNVIALLVAFGAPLNASQQTAILALVATISTLVGAYSLSRGVRKSGTTG